MATWYEDLYDEFAGRGKSFVDFMGDRLYNAGQTMDDIGTALGWSREDKNKIEYAFAGVPYLGEFVRARDNWNYMDDYMKATGINWSDIPYPSLIRGAGSIGHAVSSTAGFVSDNIKSLYEDDPSEETNRLLRQLVRQQNSPKRYRW